MWVFLGFANVRAPSTHMLAMRACHAHAWLPYTAGAARDILLQRLARARRHLASVLPVRRRALLRVLAPPHGAAHLGDADRVHHGAGGLHRLVPLRALRRRRARRAADGHAARVHDAAADHRPAGARKPAQCATQESCCCTSVPRACKPTHVHANPHTCMQTHTRACKPTQEYAKQKLLLHERTVQLREIAEKLGPEAHRRRDRKSQLRCDQLPYSKALARCLTSCLLQEQL